ncbi:type IV secretory system conjugative DNA transfer family protein [Lentzea sp. NPDC042327]|uniref:type IV secretory system conjugative DNA transfer family protein n=1 Tax=Lentzea sp. NPDC042327 TaxID=3154801 RepID=UPI0033E5BCC7
MASLKDLRIRAERKTGLFSAGLLAASIGLDSWDAIADSGLIDDVLGVGQTIGAVGVAVTAGRFWWNNGPGQRYDEHRRTFDAALYGSALLGGSIALDSSAAISEGGAVDAMLSMGETFGGAGLALAAGYYWWNTGPGERRREWNRAYHTGRWAGAQDYRLALGKYGPGLLRRQVRPRLYGRRIDPVIEKLLANEVMNFLRLNRPLDFIDRHIAPGQDSDYGQFLGRSVTGRWRARRRKVFASFERCLLFVAPPGKGKTAMMIHQLLDAPGAALVASTKPDLWWLTSELRARKGPIALFNPQGMAGLKSTLKFNPLIGCEHYQTAVDRASDLVSGCKMITAMQEASWGEKCVEILSKYLMAARLGGYDLHRVVHWLSHNSDEEAVLILQRNRNNPQASVPVGWAESLHAEMKSDADRMKASIWSLARGAVAFMANPVIAQSCSAGADDAFDAQEFIANGGTLYLLGDDRDETIAPLLSALTSYIYEEVKKAALLTGIDGRLDPSFGFFLDEVTKITPVPVHKWAADARAFGIYITICCQAFSALVERWGANTVKTIMNLFSKVVFGGVQDPDDLDDLVKLLGRREFTLVSTGESESASGTSRSRSKAPKEEQLLKADEIAQIPDMHAIAVIGNAKPVMIKFTKGQVRAKKELEQLRRPLPTTETTPTQTRPRVLAGTAWGEVVDLDERRGAA